MIYLLVSWTYSVSFFKSFTDTVSLVVRFWHFVTLTKQPSVDEVKNGVWKSCQTMFDLPEPQLLIVTLRRQMVNVETKHMRSMYSVC